MSKSQVDLSEVHLEDLLDVHLEDLLSADAEQVLEVLLWVVVVLRPDWLMKLAAFLAWADTDRDKAAVGRMDFDWVVEVVDQELENHHLPLM